ncbi:MAG: hypothetical protein ACXW08_02460 [Solirubrobacteraceae bacterium]
MRPVVEGLAGFAGRGACTDAERRAALWLHGELRARGREAWVETRWVRPQRAAALALACLAAVAGGLLSTVAPVPGLAIAAVARVALGAHGGGRNPLLLLFPRRATQHVLAGADHPAPLVVAAYDAPRRGLVLNDRWRARLRRLPYGGLAACGAAVTAAAAARTAGIDAAWLGIAQLLPTLVLLAALAAAVDIALSDHSPGANDNASGVAVALALFEALDRRAALLLVGAGHAVPRAVDDHLRRERLSAEVLEIGPCGGGRPHRSGRRIACLDERGIAPRAHQPDDLPEHVDDDAMDAALAFSLEDAERGEVLDRL